MRSTVLCNQYYFYLVDEDFSPLFIKFSGYFPYTARVCLNGNDYLKRQLEKEGIAYQPLDNGIFFGLSTGIADWSTRVDSGLDQNGCVVNGNCCVKFAHGEILFSNGDHTKAHEVLLPCAMSGHIKAQGYVGTIYSVGLGVSKDNKKAVKWIRKAAKQGLSSAQASLANHFIAGTGVERNPKEAIKWFRAAAEQGDVGSKKVLSLAYKHGWWGLKPDSVKSKYWLNFKD